MYVVTDKLALAFFHVDQGECNVTTTMSYNLNPCGETTFDAKHADMMKSALQQQGLDSAVNLSHGSQRLFHIIDNRTKSLLFEWPSASRDSDLTSVVNFYNSSPIASNASCFQCTQQTLRPTDSSMIDRLIIPYGCITFASVQLSALQPTQPHQRRRESSDSDNSNGTDNSEGHTCLTETHPETGPAIPYARRASSVSQPYLVRSTRSLSSPTTARRVASSRSVRDRYSPPAAHKNYCESCGTDSSPEWRRGPSGHKTYVCFGFV
ncbi:hypothetical protein DFQ28_011191 [Apophysomyces sp. BC1034]|nr:hypothetical protein DFQ28_011191 [Apophysomyces sp. BC1034]